MNCSTKGAALRKELHIFRISAYKVILLKKGKAKPLEKLKEYKNVRALEVFS